MFLRFAQQSARRTFATAARSTAATNTGSRSAVKLAGAGIAGAGAVLAFNYDTAFAGSPDADFKAARSDIADLIGDENVKNPSKDDGAQGGGGGVAPVSTVLNRSSPPLPSFPPPHAPCLPVEPTQTDKTHPRKYQTPDASSPCLALLWDLLQNQQERWLRRGNHAL